MEKPPQVKVATTAQIGDVIPVKTKAWHPMETGWRKDSHGQTIPRDRVTNFVCMFNGKEVFSAEFFSGVAANPYLTFFVRVEGSGVFDFIWQADGGKTFKTSSNLSVATS